MPIDFQPETKIDFRPETTIDFQPEPKRLQKEKIPKGLTYRPFAEKLRSLLRRPTTAEKKEQIGKVMERSKWDIEGLTQWTKGYWDAVSKGKIKEFQKIERRLSEEKRNPIDFLEKVGWAGMAVGYGAMAGQMLEPAFVSAVAKIRPDLAKPITRVVPKAEEQKLLVRIEKLLKQGREFRKKAAAYAYKKEFPKKLEKEANRIQKELLRVQLRLKEIQKAKPEITPSITPRDPIQKVIIALKRAKPIRRAQETIYTKERAARLAKGLAVEEKVIGEAGYEKGFYAKLGALKGEMPKAQFESIRKDVSEQDIESLFRTIKESRAIPEWGKITAAKGLGKLFGEYGGRVPTEGELSLLNRVFPPEFTKALLDARPMLSKMKEAGYQLANIPRSIKASFDLSFGFRQGIFLLARYPKQFFSAFFKQFKAFGWEKSYRLIQEEISRRRTYELMKKGKLALTEMGRTMGTREEAFMGQWAEKIPVIGRVVRASGRAYTGFANKLRADIFDHLVNKATVVGRDPFKDLDLTKGIAEFVNRGSGRGSLGGFERSAVTLNTFLFSPRLIASRIGLLNPIYYIKQDPFVRKEALKALFSFVGMGLTVLGLAKMGGLKVGVNPRSADFGKIKIGNTRIDIWGGFQQYFVPAARLITGQVISSTTGKVMTLGKGYRPLTRYEIILRGIEFKLSPVCSFAKNLLKGQTVADKPVTVSTETKNLFIPMAIEDVYDIMVDDPNLIPVSLLGIFGVGLQTYKGRGTPFSFKGISRTGGKLKLGGKSTATGKLSLGK